MQSFAQHVVCYVISPFIYIVLTVQSISTFALTHQRNKSKCIGLIKSVCAGEMSNAMMLVCSARKHYTAMVCHKLSVFFFFFFFHLLHCIYNMYEHNHRRFGQWMRDDPFVSSQRSIRLLKCCSTTSNEFTWKSKSRTATNRQKTHTLHKTVNLFQFFFYFVRSSVSFLGLVFHKSYKIEVEKKKICALALRPQ